MVDYFAVLGVKRSASDAEIREAYRRLAKIYHPDSNPGTTDSDAARRMQLLNEAKAVLFDSVKREEHRVTLGLREKLSAERLQQLRAEMRFRAMNQPSYGAPNGIPNGAPYGGSSVPPFGPRSQPSVRNRSFRFGRPRSKWDRIWRKWLAGIVAAALVIIAVLITHEVTSVPEMKVDPVKQIIARYEHRTPLPFDTAVAEIDTMVVADDTLPRLKRHGDILFNLGEYRSASKYYERYLQHDSLNEAVITNLSFAYFKRGRYAESLEVLSKQMHGDSNLVVAYYNIGELFLKEEKPFDARNAFEAAVKVGEDMRSEGRTPPAFTNKARAELAKLD